jgi:hypothetical protein
MDLSHWVSSIVAFVRAGYPTGIPARVSNDDITAITRELIMRRCQPISAADVGVAITYVTNELPSDGDIARVQRRLHAIGCARD